MENLKQDTIDLLDQLVEINNDRIEGYEKAMEILPPEDSYGLYNIFEKYRSQSFQFNAQLKPLIAQMGDVPTEGTRTSGKLFRTWMEAKAMVAPNTVKAILESCERGEDEFKRVYMNTLEKCTDAPADIITLIQSQATFQKEAHDHIKQLRDNISGE